MSKIIIAIYLLINIHASASESYSRKRGVAPVNNQQYINECASCHFAYQAGLLPQRSWKKIMGNLENHFGTDASLEKIDEKQILKYLQDNSAEKFTNYKRSRKINASIASSSTPVYISKTPYLKSKHKKIPSKYITQKEVISISNCMACHTKANTGSYSERQINIPNYGAWDD